MKERELIKKRLQERAEEGKISCAAVFKISEELDCAVRDIGRVANELNIKIVSCQIGCF